MIPNPQPDWSLISLCASHAARAYLGATVSDPRSGTQATVAPVRDNQIILVAFRGSSEARDFIQDAKFLKEDLMYSRDGNEVEVHAGFIAAFESVDVEVVKQVKNLLGILPGARIIITGHSLGGALAQLCALEFARQKLPLDLVVTFGSPRVGNKTFATIYNEAQIACKPCTNGGTQIAPGYNSLRDLTLNVVNEGDPVPLLPPLLNGYRDCGTEYFLRRNGAVQVNPFIGMELFADLMGAIARWRNFQLGLLPNHFIAAYRERIARLL